MSADILATAFADLEPLVRPRSVVLIGASDSPGSVGARLTENVLDHSSVAGEVFLVNARREEVHGQKAYSSVLDLPSVPDVAVIVVGAELVPGIVRDCAELGIPFAAVLSSGFSETGEAGAVLERELTAIAAETGIRIYGPNCPGISNINERIGLNFSPAFAADLTPGVIGLATQGGGLGRTLLQAMERGLGVAQWLSSGNEADLGISDFIHHLASSPDVKVIAAIIEGIRDGERFVQAALHARRLNKPIIAIKLGRSDYGRAAAMSHTTSMTGESAINSAVFAQLGIIEVFDLSELIDTAALFAQRLPGPDEGVAVYTYSGGTAALTADMIGAAGLRLADFSADTGAALREALPRFGTHSNPVDTGTEVLAKPELIRATLEPVLSDPGVGVTIVPVPIEMGRTTAELSSAVVSVKAETGATVVPVWMTDRLGEGYRILAENKVVPARSLSNAVAAIAHWSRYGSHSISDDWMPLAHAASEPAAVRVPLSEIDAKAVLSSAGIGIPRGRVCTTADEAVAFATETGFPLAMKVSSADILHKTEAGGVRLGVADLDGVATAFSDIIRSVAEARPDAVVDGILVEEMIAGSGYEALVAVHRDPTFGPILTVGSGGVLVELLKDSVHVMPPVSDDTARGLIDRTTLGLLLRGHRGRPAVDLAALTATIVRVSDYVAAHPSIDEFEINPLWISETGDRVVALDSLIVTIEHAEPTWDERSDS